MKVKSERDLRLAYENLLLWKECASLIRSEFNRKKYDHHGRTLKREIREYHRVQSQKPIRAIVRDDGIDGYVEKVPVPVSCRSEEDREKWFDSEERLICRPSPYDTGQRFTGWHHFAKLHGQWYLYHCVHVDI